MKSDLNRSLQCILLLSIRRIEDTSRRSKSNFLKYSRDETRLSSRFFSLFLSLFPSLKIVNLYRFETENLQLRNSESWPASLLKLIIELANFRLHSWLTSKFPAVTLSLLNHPYRRPHPPFLHFLRQLETASRTALRELQTEPSERGQRGEGKKKRTRNKNVERNIHVAVNKKKKRKKNTWNDDHHDIVKILSNTDVFEYIQLKLQ